MQINEDVGQKIRNHLQRKHHIEMSISSVNKPRSEVFPVMHKTGRELLNLKLDTKYVATKTTDFRRDTLGFETVDIKDLLCDHNHVMLTGPAGSGKSSALKYFAKKVTADEIQSHRDRIKLVIFLEFKHMLREGDVSLSDVLLGGSVCPNITTLEKNNLLAWMTENDEKILFVIDGYDQINHPLDKDEITSPGYYDASKKKSFIKAILNRNLFPLASILTSSREYAVQDVPGCCRPDSFITLNGLSPENINLLITEMAGDIVLSKLTKTKNYLLYSFCSNPLYLTYITSVFSRNPENPPETATGLTAAVVYNILTSCKHSHERTLESFRKLTNLAFFGTGKGKVVFEEQDLKNHRIKDKDIEDLLISVPPFQPYQTNMQSILEGSYKKYFCHQTIQELFSAIHIVMLPIEEFEKILETKGLHNNWDVVIRMVYGLLFQPEIPKLFEDMKSYISRAKENKKHDSKGRRSTDFPEPTTKLRITNNYAAVETRNAAVVNLSGATINFNAPETISTNTTDEAPDIMKNKSSPISPIIVNCQLRAPWSKLGAWLQDKQIYRETAKQYIKDKIEIVNVKMLHRLYEAGNGGASMISKYVKKINLSSSAMENYNACVLGKILSRCKSLDLLDLSQCKLTEDHIAVIVEALNFKCCKIKHMELSRNPNIVGRNLAIFVSLAGAIKLDLINCAIVEKKFEEFVNGFANVKIPIINQLFIAENPGIVGKALARFIVAAHIKEIGLLKCQITTEQMSDFVSEFVQAHNTQIRILNIKYSPDAFGKSLARLVSCTNLDELVVSKCEITAEKFKEFVSAFDPTNFPKICHLDISYSPGIVDGPLARFLVAAKVSSLRICDVQISENSFENFVRNLQDHNFSKIDMQSNALSPVLNPSLKRLLQHVEGEVWLTGNVVDDDVKRILIEASENCENQQLKWW